MSLTCKRLPPLLFTASMIILASQAAAAQEVPSAASGSTPVVNQTKDQNLPPPSDDIVVTATRRSERLQNVPLAVTALSGAQLAASGFKSFSDIQYQTTGVQIPSGEVGANNGIRLRGVGSAAGFSSSSEQNVGMVIDNVVVPFGNPIGSLGDLERVEVLKGPQGTQFGKNASSGVINIVTRRPDLEKITVSAFASYASLNERDVHGSVNVPLGTTVAAQVYAYDRAYDGYVYNKIQDRDWGGNHTYGTRGKLLFQPSETFSALVIGDYSRSTTKGNGQLWTVRRLSSTFDPFFSPPFTTGLVGVAIGRGNDISVEDYGGDQRNTTFGASLELNLALGDYNLSSITAWRKQEQGATNFSIDAGPLRRFTGQNYGNQNEFYSQELRLTSPSGGTFEYVGGVFASRLIVGPGDGESAQLRPDPTNPGLTVSVSNGIGYRKTRSDSVAGFIDGSIRLTDTFKLLAGGRVTHDSVNANSYSVIDPAYAPGPGPNGFVVPYVPNALATASVSRTDWSGRAGVEFKPQTDVLLYGTVARGYLGPTTTFSILTNTKANVLPQTVTDITVGAKMQFLQRRATINVNMFYDKYNNLQTSVFTNGEFLSGNAGGLKTKGFEVEAILRPIDRWRFNLGYTYADASYTDFLTDCPQDILISPLGAADARCKLGPAGTQYQAAGQQLVGSPTNTITYGTNFDVPVGNTLLLDGSLNYYFRDKVYNVAGDNLTRAASYDLVNANLGIGDAKRGWRLGFFVRNLLDNDFDTGGTAIPFAPAGALVNTRVREQRRTIGVSGEINF